MKKNEKNGKRQVGLDKWRSTFFTNFRVYGIVCAVIAVLVFSIYYSSLNAPFYFDDKPLIVNNTHIHADDLSVSEIVLKPLQGPARFRVVPMISFALNFYFNRLNTVGYRFVNIMLHILNCVLLFALIRNTLRCNANSSGCKANAFDEKEFVQIAFLATLLWAVSPLHINSVTYIIQRMNLMAMTFSLLTLLCYLKGRGTFALSGAKFADSDIRGEKASTNKSAWFATFYLLIAFVFAILAVFSKENAAILPVVIIVYELFFFKKYKKDESVGVFNKLFIPFLLCLGVVAVFLISHLWFGKNPIAVIQYSYVERSFTMWERLMSEARILWYYLSLLILPLPGRLQLVYDYQLSTSLFAPWATLPAILGLIGVAVATYRFASKYRLEVFCVVWFFLQSLIESSVVGLELIFEHRTYIPSAFFFLFIVLLLRRYLKNRRTVNVLIAIFAVFSIYCSFERNRIWSAPERFWGDNYRKSPKEARVMLNYANSLSVSGKKNQALELYCKLLKVDPSSPYVHYNCGEVLAWKKDYKNAEKYFKRALELDKHFAAAYLSLGAVCQKSGRLDEAMANYLKAEKNNQDNPIILTNIASLYRELNEWEKSEMMYKRALEISPEMTRASLDLGFIYIKDKKFAEASKVYNDALEYHPRNAEIYYRLGIISMHEKDYNGAIIYLQRALILNPELTGVRKCIADINSLRGNTVNALNTYRDMLERDPDDYTARNNLGLLLLKTGDVITAEEHFLKALNAKPDFAAALKNMGNIMFIQKDYTRAERYYVKALKITPCDAVLHHNLGSVYAFIKDYKKAVDSYRNAINIKDDYYEAKQNLKRVLKHL